MSNKKQHRQCLIKSSTKIFKALTQRMIELELTYKDIVEDAAEYGRKIDMSSLSRYLNSFDENAKFKGYRDGTLSQEDVIWLCLRYGIAVSLTVDTPKYSERKCIKTIKDIFGNVETAKETIR